MPNRKNTGKPYEKLTQKIFDQIINQDSAHNIEVKHDVILQGKTTTHQIDVYWKFDLNGIQYQTIIQAKDWKTKVKKEHIFAFKGVLDDLPYGTSGIFVSQSGFQSGAIDVARAYGIRLYELRKPTDEDWGNTITSVAIHQHLSGKKPFLQKMMQSSFPQSMNMSSFLPKSWMALFLKVCRAAKSKMPASKTQITIPAVHGHQAICSAWNIETMGFLALQLRMGKPSRQNLERVGGIQNQKYWNCSKTMKYGLAKMETQSHAESASSKM